MKTVRLVKILLVHSKCIWCNSKLLILSQKKALAIANSIVGWTIVFSVLLRLSFPKINEAKRFYNIGKMSNLHKNLFSTSKPKNKFTFCVKSSDSIFFLLYLFYVKTEFFVLCGEGTIFCFR